MNNNQLTRASLHSRSARRKLKSPFYKKWWFWTIIAIVIILGIGIVPTRDEETFLDISNPSTTLKSKGADINFTTNKGNEYKVVRIGSNKKAYKGIAKDGKETITAYYSGKYRLTVYNNGEKLSKTFKVKPKKTSVSDLIADIQKKSDNTTSNSDANNDETYQSNNDNQPSEPAPKQPDVPVEYKSALDSAKTYSNMMHMSKLGIYGQLTSEYGDKFTPEAAQYAVDNLQANYQQNALESAKTYQTEMSMSPEAIRDQLTSEYGDQFTQEEANYAVEHLNE